MPNLVSGAVTLTSSTSQTTVLTVTGASPPQQLLIKRVIVSNKHASTATPMVFQYVDALGVLTTATFLTVANPAASNSSIDLGDGILLPKNCYVTVASSTSVDSAYATVIAELVQPGGA